MYTRMSFAAFIIFIVLVPCARAQNDKVYRGLTVEETEKLLQEMKVPFKKESNKKKDEHFFDFVRDKHNIRLSHFSGDEIMLDCVFSGLPIEKVNEWNTITRLSRARLDKHANGEVTVLEYGLDTRGGVTAGTIQQFLARFDDEVKQYEKFVSSLVDDNILAEVTNEKLENILKSQGIACKTGLNKAGIMMFDFELGGRKLRMYNFGGKDLMIDVHFKKIPLEEANHYNLNNKFVRVVNYRGKDIEYTALECNLDCSAGVSEGMIRHWILAFGGDVRDFSDYVKKLTEPKK